MRRCKSDVRREREQDSELGRERGCERERQLLATGYARELVAVRRFNLLNRLRNARRVLEHNVGVTMWKTNQAYVPPYQSSYQSKCVGSFGGCRYIMLDSLRNGDLALRKYVCNEQFPCD